MEEIKIEKHLNYALVEETRPPMYTAMKYWGKKPHNIWKEFIEVYCPEGGVVFDPFSGSGMSAFEAVKANRKSIAFDLNPLTSFVIEVTTSSFDYDEFYEEFSRVYDVVKTDPIYIDNYTKEIEGYNSTVYNYKWFEGKVNKVAVEICKPDKAERVSFDADESDLSKADAMENIEIPYWFPQNEFPNSPMITHKFIQDIGGNKFYHLWTRRNLYIFAKIFNEILKVEKENIKKQLLYGFIQSLHLSSKMVVPRNAKSNRDFSGSWGRPDYMIRRNSMEQNPLIVFKRSCIDKQGVASSLIDAQEKLKSNIKISNINEGKKIKKKSDINYGIVDIADISDYISDKSVDFIITDPPYAGLVPYLDLSLIWLIWLEKLDGKYAPSMESEITVKKGYIERAEYKRRLINAFKQLHRVLRDDGYLVVTFHHNKIQEWNDFVQAVRIAGFKFDKVTHQYNRRSGEANVANPYGTSGADFYIRCVKQRDVDFTDDQSGLNHFILQKTIEIVSSRGEKTPFSFIISGLIPEMLQAGYLQPNEYQAEVKKILLENAGDDGIFSVSSNDENKSGDYWWFNEPTKYINYPDIPLKERVKETVLALLRRKISVRVDDVLSEIFQTFPNGLTPDPRNITTILSEYAYKSASKWKMKSTTITNITKHTALIDDLVKIANRAGFNTFVGKREQPEMCGDGVILRDRADFRALDILKDRYHQERIKRIEMVDLIWLDKKSDEVKVIFEVENSTGFIAAIQRASNLEIEIPKIMVIPDTRVDELLRISDPLFVKTFKEHNWRYIKYSTVKRLSTYSTPKVEDIINFSSKLI